MPISQNPVYQTLAKRGLLSSHTPFIPMCAPTVDSDEVYAVRYGSEGPIFLDTFQPKEEPPPALLPAQMADLPDTYRRTRTVKNMIAMKNDGKTETVPRIVCVGSNSGGLVADFVRDGYQNVHAVGYEYDPRPMKRAVVCHDDITVAYHRNAETCHHREGKFDYVLLVNVLDRMPDPVAYLKELHGYMAPRSHLFVEVPNANDIRMHLDCYRRQAFHSYRPVVYTAPLLKDMLHLSGFYGNIGFYNRHGLSHYLKFCDDLDGDVSVPSDADTAFCTGMVRNKTTDTLFVWAYRGET